MLTDSHKINYIYKKILGKPTTLIQESTLQEPNIIFGNSINSRFNIFDNNILRDSIPNYLSTSFQSSNLDDNNNNIINSLVGKTDSTNTIRKFVKIPMHYIPGSKITDTNNNIIQISFYLDLLEDSIPYNFDPNGSYNYILYRYNRQNFSFIELNVNESNWVLDNDTGVLTFYTSINSNLPATQHITTIYPPYISFYKYVGGKGLYPFVFQKNELISVKSNINIDENLLAKKDITINNNLNLSTINFTKLNELPTTNSNQLVYVSNNLYFNHNSQWLKLTHDDLILQNNEQFIYNHNTSYNIANVNTNISIIEITQNLTNDIYIVLPNIQKTGVEKTILMGQSVSKYINNHNIILYSNFLDVNGTGPIFMNIKFISTGQSIKLMSVISNNNSVYGNGNKYWQIISGHFHSTDIFETDNSGNLINTNDSGAVYQPNVNNTQYESMTHLITNQAPSNLLLNTHIINESGTNILSLNSEIILFQLNTNLTQNKNITLDLENKSGQKKTLLVGDSFETYKNGFYITIDSTFMGGYNTDFLTTVSQKKIKFIKSGQSVQLISMKTSSNTYYWHVLHGDYEFI
tara:strand:+ start:13493 stop:15223 length:1731 start_codon:yes stop_codon:yes gene_type:complete